MYEYIIDPISNNIYPLHSNKSKKLLLKFINTLIGGSDSNKRHTKLKNSRNATKISTRMNLRTKLAKATTCPEVALAKVTKNSGHVSKEERYEKTIENLKHKWKSPRYHRTSQFRFFYTSKKRPMNPNKGIKIHNAAFELKRHDLRYYPNCCPQNTHFFLQELYGEKDLYYGVYKYNRKTIRDIKNILFDSFIFISNTDISNKANRTIVFHFSREPLHIWAKIGEYEYLDEIRTKHKLLGSEIGFLEWGNILSNIDNFLKTFGSVRDFHITIEMDISTSDQKYIISFYKTEH